MCCYFDGWWRYTVVQHTLSHNLRRYFCSLQCDFHRVFTGTFLYHLFSFTRQPPLICCSTFVSPFLLSAFIFRIHDKNAMYTHSSAGRSVCTTASSAFLFLRFIIDCCRIFGSSVLNRKQIGCVANGFIEECVRIQMHQFKKMASIRCIFVPFSHLLKPNHDAKATNYWNTLQELLLVLCAQFHMWMAITNLGIGFTDFCADVFKLIELYRSELNPFLSAFEISILFICASAFC